MAVKRSTVARGRAAERQAADAYRARGAEILCMNYRAPGGELDIVALEGECVVFIEVKSRATAKYGAPDEAVTPLKQRRICKAALCYASEHGLMDAPMRFDVCAIDGKGVRIYENAFDYTV